jgi:hypothetical protein
VEQIVKEAQVIDFNPGIPLKFWLRSAATLLKEVCEITNEKASTYA